MAISLASLVVLVVAGGALRGMDGGSLFLLSMVGWVSAIPLVFAIFAFRPSEERSNRVWIGLGLAFAITVSIFVTRWPLRLAAAAWRPELEALASSVASGHAFGTPRRVGLFVFQRGEVERGFVCLWTDLHRNGRSGFVHGQAAGDLPFNEWSVVSCGVGWHFLIED